MPFIVGLVVAYLSPNFVDFTSDFRLPGNFLDWADQEGYGSVVSGLWDVFAVQLIGAGLLTIAVTYLFTAQRFSNWILIGFLVFVSEVICMHFLLPLILGNEITFSLSGETFHFWDYSHQLVVLPCAFVGAWLGTKAG